MLRQRDFVSWSDAVTDCPLNDGAYMQNGNKGSGKKLLGHHQFCNPGEHFSGHRTQLFPWQIDENQRVDCYRSRKQSPS